jgi:four helix bundle protein
MHNFKELKVWQKSRELVKEIYLEVSNFPSDEKFGLSSQLKRAAVSVPSNIAEGAGRNSNKDFARFLNISLGSAYELETQIILSFDLALINKEQLDKIINSINEVQKMIHGLSKSLQQDN